MVGLDYRTISQVVKCFLRGAQENKSLDYRTISQVVKSGYAVK